MLNLELHLLGKPGLLINGAESVIEPRIAFEVFAQVVCAGEAGISRVDLARRFWPHLDEKNSRQQLRIALYRLRTESKRLGIGDVCNFDDQSLRLRQQVETDVERIGQKKSWTLAELDPLLLPFARGWKEAHWTAQKDTAGELIADAFEAATKARHRREKLAELLRKAVQIYPTTTKLTLLLVKQLLAAGAEVEANEVVIRFEEHWVERFGAGDIPELMSHARSGTLSPAKKRHSILLVTGLSATLVLLAVGLFLLSSKVSSSRRLAEAKLAAEHRVADLLPNLRPVRTSFLNEGGHHYKLNLLQERTSEMSRMFILSDGAYVVTPDLIKPTERVIWETNQHVRSLDESSDELVDRDGEASLWKSKSKPEVVTLRTPSTSVKLTGTEEYPRIYPERFVTPDSFLFNRIDDSAEASSSHLCLYQNGLEFPLDFGLGKVRVSVLTAVHDHTIYGKLSYGRSDGWTYHAFSYDLDTRRSAILKCPPILIVSSTGDLATGPEVTDVKNGDYSTTWSHQVKLFPKNGPPRLLSINGQTQFEVVENIGDALVLKTDNHFDRPKFIAIDFQGREMPSFNAFLAKATNVQTYRDGKRGIVRLYNPKAGLYDYVWVEVSS